MAHFNIFGFLVLRHAFSSKEMKIFTDAAEKMWTVEEGDCVGGKQDPGATSLGEIVERHPRLTSLAEDDRIFGVIEQLLGPGFIWAGSEGQRGRIHSTWHNDKPGKNQNKYPRIKVHLYLEPTAKETGALRVIPGSHRTPFHESLEPLMGYHLVHGNEYNSNMSLDEGNSSEAQSLPFGVDGPDIPCYAFESNPGDVIFFHQCIYHAVYGGLGEGRRYIAVKFAAKPTTVEHIHLIKKTTEYVFHPHEAFLKSDRPRIRGMVENLKMLEAERLR